MPGLLTAPPEGDFKPDSSGVVPSPGIYARAGQASRPSSGETAMRLENKVALITGAGSGIGRESARLFAQEGARIVVVDVNDAAGQAVVAELRSAGREAVFFHADVSQAQDAEGMIQAAEDSFGRLDVLFNNAGISHPKDDDAVATEEE